MNNDSPARNNSGRALSWTPSPREQARQKVRSKIARKRSTIAAASSRDKDIAAQKVTKIEKAKLVGATIARKATELGLNTVVFDRGGNLYHGRVKSVADGAREGGLQF